MEKSAIKQELDNNEEAVKYLLEAFDEDDPNIEVIQRLVSIYLETKKINDAEYFNEILLKKFPDDPSGFITPLSLL